MSIFVSIAAYRDPQLAPTIRDCFGKARRPRELRFGICWQRGSREPPLLLPEAVRSDIIEVDWRESGGACWARAEIMHLWNGEDYFLQLDSHHRFVADWDVKLMHHMRNTGSAKPILSTYGTAFTPGGRQALTYEPMRMDFDQFTPNAIAVFQPAPIPNWRNLDRPIRARFVSAHFLFTIGDFVRDVPYDPSLYFIGEEISLSIRAFTHGYDLFHPPEPIVWHEYERLNRTKHWEDHISENGVSVPWFDRDRVSIKRVQQFLLSPTIGPFGCGRARSFADYERYSGLSFRKRQVQSYTRDGKEPPNPPIRGNWATVLCRHHVIATVNPATLPVAGFTDPEFWYFGVHDAQGREIYREDLQGEELKGVLAGGRKQIRIVRDFDSHHAPVTWTVWPFSRSRGWLLKIKGRV